MGQAHTMDYPIAMGRGGCLMLNLNRRGFLKGASGLIGSALLLNIVDVLPAAALTKEVPSGNTALWTPEGIIQPQIIMGQTPFPRGEALVLKLCRPLSDKSIINFALALRGAYRWVPIPGSELLITDGEEYGAVVDWWCSYMPLDNGGV